MKKNYDPTSEIDPTPMIREIEEFLRESGDLEKRLTE